MTDIITGDRLLLAIFNLSFNGTLIILGILVLRWIMIKTMKDLPRKYIVCLWAIPFFRLLCPADLSRWIGKLSLIPWNSRPFDVVNHRGIAGAPYQGVRPQVDTGWIPVDQWANDALVSSLPEPTDLSSIDPFQITQLVLFLIWVAGATALLLITAWNWWKLRRLVFDATLYRRDGRIRIYESDKISTAFVVGWIRCKIYLPAGLSNEEVDCVLLHEFAHIKRNDPLWKLLAYIAVVVHWFNPLVWIAYKTLIRDIEMACDERALTGIDPREYTGALLKLSMRGSGFLTPLAFGEGSIKERIVNALKVKEPRRVICVLAVVIIALVAVACASNQGTDEPILLGDGEEFALAAMVAEHRTSDEKDQESMLELIHGLDWGSDIELSKVNFQTNAHPYEIQLWFQWKEGLDPIDVVIDQAKIAMNEWLILSQTENIDAIAVTVTSDLQDYPTYQVVYDRETIEAANAEALAHIVSIAMDESLHPDGITFRGEPTLWDLGGDPETLLLLIRSLNVARGEVEDELFGSAKDPGVAMLLPGLPVLPVTDESGETSPFATAATQQMVTYIENLPHEISQYELREQGFVTMVFGMISDNRNRWDDFMHRYCEDYPEEPMGYPKFDSSGTGLGFAHDDFLWSNEESGKAIDDAERIPNGGGLSDDVLLMAYTTKEGDWILMGVLAYEDGFVLLRDISRDEYRDMNSAEYSVRLMKHLVYEESEAQGDLVDYAILLTDQSAEEITFENMHDDFHWELYSGYRPKWELVG
ncbi:MAG: hypothetical protein II983_05285 [Firmicutes bacterium]|nr:hypothetical protein [Bacillota bacterium]